jgi:hypothetical protein
VLATVVGSASSRALGSEEWLAGGLGEGFSFVLDIGIENIREIRRKVNTVLVVEAGCGDKVRLRQGD